MKSSIFWDITSCSPVKVNDVSEEHIVSIFRVISQKTELFLEFLKMFVMLRVQSQIHISTVSAL
jgi:hypothetical protein